MTTDEQLAEFEADLRAKHPGLDDSSVDYFVRQRRRRLKEAELA